MQHLIKPLALSLAFAFAAGAAPGALAQGKDFKVALIAGKTGIMESYARETEAGFMLGLEYLTNGTMAINGRKIRVIVKDDQSKPDLGRTLLAEARAHGMSEQNVLDAAHQLDALPRQQRALMGDPRVMTRSRTDPARPESGE